ncbi:MAG: hypothetical protein QG625_4252 [Cyanobacteriota bacterium erpe_2018_sw_39hr_WHONDRS-SW48-000098_B_bin.30]|nr:hypothetical protein [Cyanobacteriota bacterium erpe_2018_sw_39hr_WHONDRS-SW48-000098_B_bin.30]
MTAQKDTIPSNEQKPLDTSVRLLTDGSIGVFTTVAIILLLWGLCWLKSYSSLRPPQHIKLIFHEIAGLNDNAAVYVDGVRVGMVEQIEWLMDRRVLVKLRIHSPNVRVPQGAVFSILTNGVVGAKYIEIKMPAQIAGAYPLPLLDERVEVMGEDPVRPELALNNLAIGLAKVDMEKFQRNFEADRNRLARAADQLSILATKTIPLVDRALPMEEDIKALTSDVRKITHKIAKFLDNPATSGDLRESAQSARAAMADLKDTMHDLSDTLKDKSLRQDLVTSMNRLTEASKNIEQTAKSFHDIALDKDLRADVKQILSQTRATLTKVDETLSKPANKNGSLRDTLSKTHDAIDHLDLAARQLNQILSKRSPLLQMIVGRPGYIKPDKVKKQKSKKTVETTVETTKSGSEVKTTETLQVETPQVETPVLP